LAAGDGDDAAVHGPRIGAVVRDAEEGVVAMLRWWRRLGSRGPVATRDPRLKYMNAAQTMAVMRGLDPGTWPILQACGDLHGGGVYQEDDGEVTIHAFFTPDSVTVPVPAAIDGFRIVVEYRPRMVLRNG
jgi:hypothetical protein